MTATAYLLIAIYAGKFGQDMIAMTFPSLEACKTYAAEKYQPPSGVDWICFPVADGPIAQDGGLSP